MDCTYSESTGTPKTHDTRNEVSSPEMFESDEEEDDRRVKKDFSQLLPKQNGKLSWEDSSLLNKCSRPTDEELIAKSDCYLLARINKFLAGVPPPPKHTICQSDCSDLLNSIKANREYFLLDPLRSCEKKDTKEQSIVTIDEETREAEKVEKIIEGGTNKEKKITVVKGETALNHLSECSFNNHRGKSSLRNLTNAFDACERNDETTTSVEAESTREHLPETSDECRTSFETTSNENIISKIRDNDETESISRIDELTLGNHRTTEIMSNKEKTKHVTFQMPQTEMAPFFKTVDVEDVINMPWDLAYRHKTHGIQ